MTTPTGPAAGVHLPWAEVPGAVRTWAAEVGGGAPTSTRDLAGGFSPGATTVLDCPRGAIFVKAVGSELNADSPVFHRREAVVSAALPPAPEFPRLARRLRRRRLGGTGLRGHRRPPSRLSVGGA